MLQCHVSLCVFRCFHTTRRNTLLLIWIASWYSVLRIGKRTLETVKTKITAADKGCSSQNNSMHRTQFFPEGSIVWEGLRNWCVSVRVYVCVCTHHQKWSGFERQKLSIKGEWLKRRSKKGTIVRFDRAFFEMSMKSLEIEVIER